MSKNRRLFFLYVFTFLMTITLCLSIPVTAQDDDRDYPIFKDNQNVLFEHIGREEGLSNLSVSGVTQDKNGFLWIGTQGGLNRYDGQSFYKYRYDPLRNDWLPNNLIQSMFYDEEAHVLWLGTYGGLSKFDIDAETFTNYTSDNFGLDNQLIIAIYKDGSDLWFGTGTGAYRLGIEDERLDYYPMEKRTVRSIGKASDGTLYIGTAKGLFTYDYDKDKMIPSTILSDDAVVMSINEFEKNVLSFGTWFQGLFKYHILTKNKQQILPGEDHIYTTYQTGDGVMWMATWGGGLYADVDGELIRFSGESEENNLSHPVAYSLYQDDSGILWIGTNGGGLNYINPRRDNFLLYSYDPEDETSISKGKIIEIFEDSDERLWISVANKGINIQQRDGSFKRVTKDDHEASIPNNNVRVITEFRGKMILGTDVGIGEYDPSTDTYRPWTVLQNKFIYDIEVQSKDSIWVGTREDGLYSYNLETKVLLNYHEDSKVGAITNNHIYDIHQDSEGRLWVATNNGLNMKIEGSNKFNHYYKDLELRNTIPGNQVLTINECLNGDIWFGFDGAGLAKYDEDINGFIVYTETNGLSDNTVTGILADQEDEIWASTHDGISVFNCVSQTISTIGYEDGLGGYEFSEGVFANDEFLYFGGGHGVNVIPYDFNLVSQYVPKIYITDVGSDFGQKGGPVRILNNQYIELSYDENFIVFSFMALDYDGLQDNEYFYMLEGYDDEFHSNGLSRSVSFSNLNAGDYTFKVYSQSSSEVVSETVSVNIHITPPWYFTMNAFVLYAFVVALFIFLLIKLRESIVVNRKNKELAVLNEKLEMANATLKDLSSTDGLTKSYNRRYFSTHLQEMIDLARRNSSTYISLLMIDIDFFKEINDQYGHLLGDRLLVKISEGMQKNLPRSTDILSRYGGDEFAVILYDTKVNGALLVAQKIRRIIENTEVEMETGPGRENLKVSTTTSIGLVSVLPYVDTTEEQIIDKADAALYRAKKSGRNCIVIYDETLD